MSDNEAVVFQGVEAVGVEERPMPTPDADEILVETKRTLVSTGTELAVLIGDYRSDELPLVHWYCHVGEVVAVGDEVAAEWLGRRVASQAGHQAYVTVAVTDC
jgi:propanol-preferring alcohol dehydrogenase